jgi:predicted nucleic acid-binding protein
LSFSFRFGDQTRIRQIRRSDVIKKSIELLEKDTLRTMDALHIGCALEWEAELFVSSDKRQILAAKKAGLKVVSV